jgi:hypothetical protein
MKTNHWARGVAAFCLVAALGLGAAQAQTPAQAPPFQDGTVTFSNPPATPVPQPADDGAGLTGEAQDRAEAADLSALEYETIFRILFGVLAIAVVLESALAVLFGWRVFQNHFSSRGLRTPVAVIVGWLVAHGLKFDVVASLYQALYGGQGEVSPLGGLGVFITGLVLAGGSAGVNNILRALGFRRIGPAEGATPRPAATEAWFSVTLQRKEAVGPVQVLLVGDAGPAVLLGMINGRAPPPAWAADFVSNDVRFPPTGGHVLAPGATYALRLAGVDKAGAPIQKDWGPFTPGAGAIIDVSVTL